MLNYHWKTVSMSKALKMLSCVRVAAACLQCSAERITKRTFNYSCSNRCNTNFLENNFGLDGEYTKTIMFWHFSATRRLERSPNCKRATRSSMSRRVAGRVDGVRRQTRALNQKAMLLSIFFFFLQLLLYLYLWICILNTQWNALVFGFSCVQMHHYE